MQGEDDFMVYPKEHWVHLRTTNVVESTFSEILNTPLSLLWGDLAPPFLKGGWGIIMKGVWKWRKGQIVSIKSGIIW